MQPIIMCVAVAFVSRTRAELTRLSTGVGQAIVYINDYPQKARWKVTNKDTMVHVRVARSLWPPFTPRAWR